VVAQVERTGTNRALVDPDRFQEYMRRDVYKQSKSDASGRAGTAVGWWYAIAGIGGTAIGGALSGIGASLLDWRLALHREGRRRVGGLFLIGAGFSWETYLLEGDARAAAVYFIVFAVVLYAAQAVSVESRDPRADGRYDRREPRGSITSRGRQPRTNPAT